MIIGAPILGRNEKCHCNSGKKYKNCCMGPDERKKHPRQLSPAGKQAVLIKILSEMPEGKYKIKFEDLEKIPTDQAVLVHYDHIEDAFTLSVVKIKKQAILLPDKRLRKPIIHA
jgi:hypothetical protein